MAKQPHSAKIAPLLALAGVFLTLVFAYLANPRFFFIDDRQLQYFPYGLAIADMLRAGVFPFLTAKTFLGSALWMDVQYAIYNPLALLLDLAIMPANLELSGLLYALVMGGLLCFAAYRLARAYKLPREDAALFAYLSGANIFVLYFYAANWQPGLASLGWMLLAWAELKRLTAARRNFALPLLSSAACIFMTVSAGWPHACVALALVTLALFIDEYRHDRRRAYRLAAAGALGAALSLPVVGPVLLALDWTVRGTAGADPRLAPTLLDLANIGNAAWRPYLNFVFTDKPETASVPFYFTAWFAAPALCFIRWKENSVRRQAVLLSLAAVFALLTVAPLHLPLLRFPIRWLPYMQASALLALLSLMRDGKPVLSAGRIQGALGLAVIPVLAALKFNPPDERVGLFLLFLAAVLTGLYALVLKKWSDKQGLYLGKTSLLMTVAIIACFSVNANFWDDGQADIEAPRPAAAREAVSYTLYSGPDMAVRAQHDTDYLAGAAGIYDGLDTINGYSSLGHKGVADVMACPMKDLFTCDISVLPLLRREPETGADWLDLLKITRVSIERKEASGVAAMQKRPGWQASAQQNLVIFDRARGGLLPGTVSWHAKSLSLSPVDFADDRETLEVANTGSGGPVVFARLYYPGFHAALNGAGLSVRALGNFLVAVDVPPGQSGRMTLGFTPPGLRWFAALAIAALGGWSFFFLQENRRRRKMTAPGKLATKKR